MKTSIKKHPDQLHAEIKAWRSEVELVHDELNMYHHQLEEILSRNNGYEAVQGAEHFQNQFIIQGVAADEMHHVLKAADNALAHILKGNPAGDHLLLDDHAPLREKMETFNHLFQKLKAEFRGYRQKWF